MIAIMQKIITNMPFTALLQYEWIRTYRPYVAIGIPAKLIKEIHIDVWGKSSIKARTTHNVKRATIIEILEICVFIDLTIQKQILFNIV